VAQKTELWKKGSYKEQLICNKLLIVTRRAENYKAKYATEDETEETFSRHDNTDPRLSLQMRLLLEF